MLSLSHLVIGGRGDLRTQAKDPYNHDVMSLMRQAMTADAKVLSPRQTVCYLLTTEIVLAND